MTDKEFFSYSGKKLLICDSFSHAENMIKRYVLSRNSPVINIERATLTSIAQDLFKSMNGNEKTIIDDQSGVYIIDALIRKNSYSFIPKPSYALSTSQAFYDCLQEIKYGLIKSEQKVDRFNKEISKLLNDYNQYLIAHNLVDTPDVFSFAIDHIDIVKALLGNNVFVGISKNLEERLRYLEQVLLNKICEIYHQDIIYVDYELKEQKINRYKVDAHGFINEINYMVDDIRTKHINPSEVNVFISGSSYETMIKSLFDFYHIPYHFINGESASLLSIVSVINYALDFVANLCDLQSIYNMLLTDAVKDEFKVLIPHLSNLKCDHVNIAKYHGTKREPLDENSSQFLVLLLEIDNSELDISSLFTKLIEFLQFACLEESYKVIEEPLKDIADHLVYIDEVSCPTINNKIDILKSCISSLRIKKEEPSISANIQSLKSGFLLDRNYNYLVGLSASQLSVKEIQSPVLNDEQLMQLLDTKYYIHLANNNNAEIMEGIHRLLNTASDGTNISYIYSSYDSVNFKNQAPSTLFVDTEGEILKADYEMDSGALIKEENASCLIANKVNKLSFSPSALETYASCPCKYILQYVEEYGKVDLAEYESGWFQGGEFGTFCHLILEKYFKENNTLEKQKAFDEKSYQNCVKKAANETIDLIPYGNQKAVMADINKASLVVERYLREYFKDTDGYLVVACEYDFTNDNITEIFEFENGNAVVSYHGKIDRIDVKIDDAGVFHIRTVDYKTSKRDNVAKKVKNGETFQGHIYDIAAKVFCLNHKHKLEKLLGKKLAFEKPGDLTNIVFEYVFPLIKGEKNVLVVTEENEAVATDKIRMLIKSIMAYNEDHDMCATLNTMNKELISNNDFVSGPCQYCNFAKHCRYKVAKGENMHPETKKEREENDGDN